MGSKQQKCFDLFIQNDKKGQTNMKNQHITMPALALRGLVIFPGMILHFDIARDRSINAVEEAIEHNDRRIFLVTQIDEDVDEVAAENLYKTGVVAEIRQTLNTPDGARRVLVQGLYTAKLCGISQDDPFLVSDITPMPALSDTLSAAEKTAFIRTIDTEFKQYSEMSPRMPIELYRGILAEKDLSKLIDLIVFNVYLRVEDKQALLSCLSLRKRAELLVKFLAKEVDIVRLEQDINEEVKEALDKTQRDFYLREQMRAISRQLGEFDDPQSEAFEYMDKIEECGFDEDTEEKLIKECEKLMHLSPGSQEAAVVRTYLDTVLDMPWNIYTHGKTDIAKAEKQLDHDHYGMKKVKERILEIVALNQWKDADKKGQIICLVGPPGVGKTSVAKSIATALGRKYARVSLGGVRDEADIRGHRKTYIGAMPGRIVNALKQAKSMNPVILFDEIDKMGTDYKGDPASAMLEVLDSEQNVAFRDHYLEIPIDLSNVLFITTANTLDTIPAPLLDRMDVIELGSYTREEKFHIAKEHLVPKQLKKHGIKPQVRFANDAIYSIIDFYTKEAGVRKLERNIAKICRMTLKKLASGEAEKINIKAKDIEGYLGARKYTGETISKQDEIGAVNGLAWTSVGGTLLPLEVLVMEGTGKIELTGSLGDVMKESAKIAVSLTRSLSRKYEIDPDFYKNKDIHIHAPEGAVPKDGPSAGVTMTTALVSALSGIPVRRDVAMTGEITLRGKVLPIGGLREKTMAAYSAGIKTVVIPDENKADMKELDDVILSNMSFVLAENIDTVLNTALVKPNVTAAKKSNEKLPSAKPRASRKTGKNAVKEI